MASFCIRLRKVLGFKLRIRAAPRSPSIIQLVWARTDSICRRSTSSRGSTEEALEVGLDVGWPMGGGLFAVFSRAGPVGVVTGWKSPLSFNVLLVDKTTARSITF